MTDINIRISFGMIVLNGEPFIRYNLRALYPFAHEIIVVEGATLNAPGIATADGHSIDTTMATLMSFKTIEDPEDKVKIVTAEQEGHPNGFWPGGKDEQSQAYAKRATGNFLWQVDVDEFYEKSTMESVIRLLRRQPKTSAVSFKMITLWGGLDYMTDGWYLQEGSDIYHRLFKWGPGYRYVTHRPPTVKDDQGRNLKRLNWINGKTLAKRGIFLLHYSVLFPEQVRMKSEYYASKQWGEYSRGIGHWQRTNFFPPLRRPFQVHNVHMHPSWIKPYRGRHPEQVHRLWSDIASGRLTVETRDNTDVRGLLCLESYRIASRFVEFLLPLVNWILFPKRLKRRLVKALFRIEYDKDRQRLVWR